ncbi:hypothetical protein [Pedobacter cryotolerans]|uniref:Uncharacterized protein n=1 Tax=Pedobacter cryotolerans TaxID=2571270 RepID=A0A4V5NXA1_9SPHI|nr:hypothetical protein [Pedobacter cryotolerans]TKB98463.1 hypothetical protein FA045_14195 [Pedobacter cryotolerans]
MKLFRKNSTSIGGDAIAEKIAQKIIDRQRILAIYLNRKTKNISGKLWMAILIGFCTAFGSYCIFLLIRALG